MESRSTSQLENGFTIFTTWFFKKIFILGAIIVNVVHINLHFI